MKKILVSLFVLALLLFLWSFLSSCGTWSVFEGIGGKPTCTCIGKIIKTGGPSGPADDSGGTFNCVGLKVPKF
ncbi:MAG TPA: hypothetical protein VMX76_00415 [Nevskiaceae bacterium]|nr:hypothetical protein [Nevskiaceae bacterium]